MVAILVFVECPKSIASEVLVVLRPYQNVKSIWQAVFKISRSQAISCIGYNVNLKTAVVGYLGFCKMPQIYSVWGLSGIKALLKCEVNLTSGFQDIAFTSKILYIWYNDNLQTAVVAILVFVECPKSIASEVLVVSRPYQNVKSIWQAVFQDIAAGPTDGQGHSIILDRRIIKNISRSIYQIYKPLNLILSLVRLKPLIGDAN